MKRLNKYLTTRIFSCSILGFANMHMYQIHCQIGIFFILPFILFYILLFKLQILPEISLSFYIITFVIFILNVFTVFQQVSIP